MENILNQLILPVVILSVAVIVIVLGIFFGIHVAQFRREYQNIQMEIDRAATKEERNYWLHRKKKLWKSLFLGGRK